VYVIQRIIKVIVRIKVIDFVKVVELEGLKDHLVKGFEIVESLWLVVDFMLKILVIIDEVERKNVCKAGWTCPMMVGVGGIGDVIRAVNRQALVMWRESAKVAGNYFLMCFYPFGTYSTTLDWISHF
jgi:hypothetical protein